jgi:hypothetical protein
MKFGKMKLGVWALGLSCAVTVLGLPQAKGELVYESEQPAQVAQAAQSVPTQVVVSQPVAVAPAQVVTQQVAPQSVAVQSTAAAASATSIEDSANMSKRELMRRERMRAELQNEDVLQERLEELRLRDERKRTDAVLGIASTGETTDKNRQTAVAPIEQQIVTAPVTEKPAIVQTQTIASLNTPVATVSAETKPAEGADESSSVMFTPKLGILGMNNPGWDVRPYYSAGATLGFTASDNLIIELGYSYNEMGINVASSNPIINQLATLYASGMGGFGGMYGNGIYGNNAVGINSFETQVMKKHLFEAGVKVQLMGRDSKVRPFIGAGLAYDRSFINYNQRLLNNMGPYGTGLMNMYGVNTTPYEVASFEGYISAGVDFKVSKTIQVGVIGKYYNVFSSRENGLLNNMAFYGAGSVGMYGGQYLYANVDKQVVGGTLANIGFYQILGTVTFSF